MPSKIVYILTVWSYGSGISAPIEVFDDLQKAEKYIDDHPLINSDSDMYDIYDMEVK
jgi:hypothetical protein